MGNPLHTRRTAAEWAAVGQVIDITEKLSGFERLESVVEADLAALDDATKPANWRDSSVTARLKFGFVGAGDNVPTVHCELAATVDAVCQRCLEPFRLPLGVDAELLLLELEETVEGYDEYEVWELTETTLRPLDIVEELLIMALPFAAMHAESAACKALSAEVVDSEEMTKPFAALREQMMRKH
jgi:uncharacterized protein